MSDAVYHLYDPLKLEEDSFCGSTKIGRFSSVEHWVREGFPSGMKIGFYCKECVESAAAGLHMLGTS